MYFKTRLTDLYIYKCLKYVLAIFNYVPNKCVRELFPTILYKIAKIKQNGHILLEQYIYIYDILVGKRYPRTYFLGNIIDNR